MSDELKPCPFCGSKAYVRDDRGEYIRVSHSLDAASYRAGLEAAAKLFEEQAKLSSDAAWSEQLCEMAGEIRALPTPSTLPQEGKP